MISDLTYKMVAYSIIEDFNPDECVDWAVEMLQAGYDTPVVGIIASMDKPVNYFEIIDYLEKALLELGISKKNGKKALFSYCIFYIIKIAKKPEVKKNLRDLVGIISGSDLMERLMDFCLLSWAWSEVDKLYNHYWSGATPENIKRIVISTARKWLEENKRKYEIKPLLS